MGKLAILLLSKSIETNHFVAFCSSSTILHSLFLFWGECWLAIIQFTLNLIFLLCKFFSVESSHETENDKVIVYTGGWWQSPFYFAISKFSDCKNYCRIENANKFLSPMYNNNVHVLKWKMNRATNVTAKLSCFYSYWYPCSTQGDGRCDRFYSTHVMNVWRQSHEKNEVCP